MTSSVAVGRQIGPAILTSFIGEGAVGVVWRGTHKTLGIEVAVKILKDDRLSHDHGWRARFHREAQIAARLNHQGVVRVLDFGEDGGHYFMIMELVDGISVEQWLTRQRAPVPEQTGARILMATAFALEAVHSEGIAHRDLKPANLLLTRKGQLKLADLGLAREHGSAHLTRDRVAVGTPSYMAPEVFSAGAQPDHRVDFYALGIIGYLLAFGRLPYTGSMPQIISGHLGGQADFHQATAWSGPAIQVIKELMAVDPQRRLVKASEVIVRLRSLSRPPGQVKRSPGDGSGSSHDLSQLGRFLDDAFAAHTSTVEGRTITHTSRGERRLVWIVLSVVVATVVIGWWLGRGGGRPTTTTAPTSYAAPPVAPPVAAPEAAPAPPTAPTP
jgi:serine/threonine protein kinase